MVTSIHNLELESWVLVYIIQRRTARAEQGDGPQIFAGHDTTETHVSIEAVLYLLGMHILEVGARAKKQLQLECANIPKTLPPLSHPPVQPPCSVP
jgi:hypothetical protein